MYSFDYIILGAGPAGLQIGYYLENKNRNYIIIERNNDVGSTFKNYPKHKKLLSINKIHTKIKTYEVQRRVNYRYDWNSLLCEDDDLFLQDITSEYLPNTDDLIIYFKRFQEKYKLNIKFNTLIVKIRKNKDNFLLITKDGMFVCKYLIICIGLQKPYIPKDIPGIEHAIGYESIDLDKNKYINKSLLIIGKGNSAFEVANYLQDVVSELKMTSKTPTTFAWETHFVGNLRAVNNDFIDSAQHNYLSTITNWNNNSIIKKNGILYFNDYESRSYDYIIRCTGFAMDTDIFDDSCKPEIIRDKFPKLKADFESTNISNLYFAGTLMQSRDFKYSSSSLIHGFRYACRSLVNILEYKIENIAFHKDIYKNDITTLTNVILNKVSSNDGIFQLFSHMKSLNGYTYFSDLIIINENNFEYISELPTEYIFGLDIIKNKNIILINYEFGFRKENEDTLNPVNSFEEYMGYIGKLIKPVIRYYPKGGNNKRLSKSLCICGEWEDTLYLQDYTIYGFPSD